MQLILNLPEDLNYGLQILNALAGHKEPAKTMTTKTASTVPPTPKTIKVTEAAAPSEPATEPSEPATELSAPIPAATAPVTVTTEQLREVAISFMKKSDAHKSFMQELVKKYGAKRVSEIPEDKASAFVNELENYQG